MRRILVTSCIYCPFLRSHETNIGANDMTTFVFWCAQGVWGKWADVLTMGYDKDIVQHVPDTIPNECTLEKVSEDGET